MMKTLISVGVSVAVLFTVMTSASADVVKKEIRNDRVTVTKTASTQIAQYDINPFKDRERKMRNDRVNYAFPKVEAAVQEKKQRVMRNDRVSVIR